MAWLWKWLKEKKTMRKQTHNIQDYKDRIDKLIIKNQTFPNSFFFYLKTLYVSGGHIAFTSLCAAWKMRLHASYIESAFLLPQAGARMHFRHSSHVKFNTKLW